MSILNQEGLDIIIPISLDAGRSDVERIESEILELKENFGFKKFALFGPGKGCRSTHYPSRDQFAQIAEQILRIRTDLEKHGIEFGWWITTTLKSGPSEAFDRPIKADGSKSYYASCPADPRFRKRFCEDLACVARIAKPSFIITEDDFSVHATTFSGGCYCQRHLDGFAEREGRYYGREELERCFAEKTSESFALLRRWRAWMKETLVTLACEMRDALDVDSPEIPLGYMQAGGADWDGDCTEAVARAMAGERHVPFSRLYGTFYCGGDTKDLPATLYHAIYTRQHIAAPFRYYHESDSYPHIRYYTSASQVRAMMAVAYAHGFDGSTLQVQQILDDPNEEPVYGRTFFNARARLEEIHRVAKQCRTRGVEICYDPFWNTVDNGCSRTEPLWARCVGLFGIPYVTTESDVAFWDVRQARYADGETVMKYLSKGLFLDGEAARVLCERGYGRYLGVRVGEAIARDEYRFDLGAKEVIREELMETGRGRIMHPPHTYACGREGKALFLTVNDPHCKILSEEFTFEDRFVSASMTRLPNELGGQVTVMGTVLDGNGSPALFNYRRQRLLQRLVSECGDQYAFVKDAPATWLVMNEAVDASTAGFMGMLTLINLCDDPVEGITLHLPSHWRNVSELCVLTRDGTWKPTEYRCTDDGVALDVSLHYCEPFCILLR